MNGQRVALTHMPLLQQHEHALVPVRLGGEIGIKISQLRASCDCMYIIQSVTSFRGVLDYRGSIGSDISIIIPLYCTMKTLATRCDLISASSDCIGVGCSHLKISSRRSTERDVVIQLKLKPVRHSSDASISNNLRRHCATHLHNTATLLLDTVQLHSPKPAFSGSFASELRLSSRRVTSPERSCRG